MGGSGSRALVLPTPGAGALGVGCADLMVDSNGQDTGIFCRVFYPTDRKTEDLGTASLNLPIWIPRREYVAGLAAYKKQSPRKFHLVFDWLVGEYRAPAVWHDRLAAPSNDEQSKFPVVIFSHGLSACRHFYSAYCSALASHGFVVVAVEHRNVVHQSFTDFTYPCKGFVGKKMGFQGETEPVICSEAAVLMSVAFLRKHFGQTGNDDALPQLIKQYEAFALDGTTLNLDDVPTSSL
uniref:1-alkyl-2-acetylglycerophosphocholine esterase n=1 Tax=Plectus sambesii TaxID=2011161 RepID=A0A914WP34_9BILA